MDEIIETKLASINIKEYPIILITSNEVPEIVKADIDHFIKKYKMILDSTQGHYIAFTDATKSVKKRTAENREYLGVSIQVLDSNYRDRHLGNYVFVPNVVIYGVIRLLTGFTSSGIKLRIGFNKGKLWQEALERIEKHKV